MPVPSYKAIQSIKQVLGEKNLAETIEKLSPVMPGEKPLPEPVPGLRSWRAETCKKRLQLLESYSNVKIPYLEGVKQFDAPETLKGNIENYIGMSQIPTGIIGPLRINGSAASGDFYVPLATTEGTLVASYNRGAKAVSESGGVTALCLVEKVQRTPSFKFGSIALAGSFLVWAIEQIDVFRQIASEHTSHGFLEDVRPHFDGNQVTLIFDFTTGDASGQNMVTICTQAICEYIIKHAPVKPEFWLVEGNLSGDKKASAISFLSTRGKKATAEAIIKKDVLETVLNTTAKDIKNAWDIAIINGIHSGSIGVNFHLSNCLTAIYIACGQDVATVSEASVGTTRCGLYGEDDLYISVTMPNLIVGTVGGGTALPTQQECLKIIDCSGEAKARKFAEIVISAALCGELSIIASIVTGSFARAHRLFGRSS